MRETAVADQVLAYDPRSSDQTPKTEVEGA